MGRAAPSRVKIRPSWTKASSGKALTDDRRSGRSLSAALTILSVLLPAAPSTLLAATSLIDEPEGDSYHLVSHYQITIDAPVDEVWPWASNLRSWMYEFELAPVSGERGKAGEVLRLYEGEEFQIQLLEVVPERMLMIANLPSESQGEVATGIAILNLHGRGSSTEVNLVMSRRYTWTGDGANPHQAVRQTEDFVRSTDTMWRDRFLARLRCLAERRCKAGDS